MDSWTRLYNLNPGWYKLVKTTVVTMEYGERVEAPSITSVTLTTTTLHHLTTNPCHCLAWDYG